MWPSKASLKMLCHINAPKRQNNHKCAIYVRPFISFIFSLTNVYVCLSSTIYNEAVACELSIVTAPPRIIEGCTIEPSVSFAHDFYRSTRGQH